MISTVIVPHFVYGLHSEPVYIPDSVGYGMLIFLLVILLWSSWKSGYFDKPYKELPPINEELINQSIDELNKELKQSITNVARNSKQV